MLAPSKDNLVNGRVVELVDTPDLETLFEINVTTNFFLSV